jgi:hypothetical protein
MIDENFESEYVRWRAICKKYNFSVEPPEPMVALALGSLGQSPIYGTRIALPEHGTVSWFFHCGKHSDSADFYQPVHIDHLRQVLPLVMDYLGLPYGVKIILDDQGYEDVWMDGH